MKSNPLSPFWLAGFFRRIPGLGLLYHVAKAFEYARRLFR